MDCKRCCKTAQACGAKDVQFSSFLQDIERVHVPENPAAPGSWMTDKLDPDTVHRECRFIRAFFVWINPVMPMICPNLFSRIMLRLKLRQHAREVCSSEFTPCEHIDRDNRFGCALISQPVRGSTPSQVAQKPPMLLY